MATVIKWVDEADDSFRYGLYRFNQCFSTVEICWSRWRKLSKRESDFFGNELLDDKYGKRNPEDR